MDDSDETRIRLGDYVLGRTLGVGSFGKVKLAEHIITSQLTAVKIINRPRIKKLGVSGKINREVRILQRFVHPHIIRLFDVIESPTDIFLVLEYGSGGELFDYIVSKGKLQEEEARKYFQQIVSGVAYCHAFNIAHRDLKPENLLLTKDHNIKVADFGLSNVMRDGQFLRTSCGSPNYAAPEVISGHLYAGPEIDVWSIGIILYALLCGFLPFDDDDIPKLFKKIKNGVYEVPSHLSEDAVDIIAKIILTEPLRRLSVDEIRQHPFFTTNLPKYLSLPVVQQGEINTSENEQEKKVDEEIVKQICRMRSIPYIQKCGKRGVLKAIRSNRCNFIKTVYNLVHDRKQKKLREQLEREHMLTFLEKRIADKRARALDDSSRRTVMNSNSQPRANLVAEDMMQVDLNPELSSTSRSNSANARMNLEQRKTAPPDHLSGSTPFSRSILSAAHAHMRPPSSRTQDIRRRKWYLGIQSKKEPEIVIREVFRVLSSLECEWSYSEKNAYRITCRWLNDNPVTMEKEKWIYLRLQLYKVQNSIYLLDFQHYGESSSSFKFLQLCGLIINCLKPPSTAPTKAQPPKLPVPQYRREYLS